MAQITINRKVLNNVNGEDLIAMLNEIIDTELDKNVEDIDTEFVNECVDALLALEKEENNFVALVPLVSSDKFLKSISKQNGKTFKNLNVFARTAIIAALIAGGTITANAMVQSFTGVSILGAIAQRIESSFNHSPDNYLIDITTQPNDNKAEAYEENEAEEASQITTDAQFTSADIQSENVNAQQTNAVPVNKETKPRTTNPSAEKTVASSPKNEAESISDTSATEKITEKIKDIVVSHNPVTPQKPKEKNLVNISADVNDFKADYIYGESFDPSGIRIYANFDDDTTEEISLKDCYYSKITIRNVTANYTFTVMYKTCKLEFDVTVRPDEDTRGSEICTSNDYDYLLTDKGAYVTAYNGSNTSLIMNTVDGHKIIAIGARVFSDNNVTEVYSKNVNKIFDYAFKDCKMLESADFPNAVYIGDYAFDGAEKLKEITYSDNVDYLGKYAFSKTSIEEIELSDKITVISEGICYSCESLKSVKLNGKVTKIGKNAFSDCIELETLSGAEIIKTVNAYAFYNDEKLNFDAFPSGLEEVGECGFYMCQSLDIGALPESVESVGKSSFAYCTKLTSITIPDTMTVIPYESFRGTGAKKITIPEGVEVIEGYAFRGVKTTEITLPDSLEKIENEGLYTPLLRKIYFGKNIQELADDAFYKGRSVTFYVYDETLPLQWAIENNIKYVLQ